MFYIPKLSWQPPKESVAFEEYVFHTRLAWDKSLHSMKCHRADKTIDAMIDAIKNRSDIIVRPSDKNLGLVVLR
jgi:hypothetical protein